MGLAGGEHCTWSVSLSCGFSVAMGSRSYNCGAGMHQVDRAARFIKAAMHQSKPNLTDQQAWDVALHTNSQELPQYPRFEESVTATAERYHQHQYGQYGKTVNGRVLGGNLPPAGTMPCSKVVAVGSSLKRQTEQRADRKQPRGENVMESTHYEGGCQCGAVAYEVDVDLANTITCNCSRCQRMGFVLAFTSREKFQLKSGESELTEYLFHDKAIRHLFCKVCGVESFAYGEMPDGTPMVAINANCLAGVDPRALDSQHVDGKRF